MSDQQNLHWLTDKNRPDPVYNTSGWISEYFKQDQGSLMKETIRLLCLSFWPWKVLIKVAFLNHISKILGATKPIFVILGQILTSSAKFANDSFSFVDRALVLHWLGIFTIMGHGDELLASSWVKSALELQPGVSPILAFFWVTY